MPVPGAEDWMKIAGDYEKLADFPNCLGAIDGKHGAVQSIPRVGSNNASREAVAVRETFNRYFSSLPGRVTWQDGI
ncbi:unnamed protein product [Arctogadus glacialis]